MRRRWASFGALWTLASITIVGCKSSTEPEAIVDPTLSSIQTNIFDARCSCHQVLVPPEARLSLNHGTSYSNLVGHKIEAMSNRYLYRVVPGQPDSSFLLAKVTGQLTQQEGDRMPSHTDILSDQQISAIRQWISAGALDN